MSQPGNVQRSRPTRSGRPGRASSRTPGSAAPGSPRGRFDQVTVNGLAGVGVGEGVVEQDARRAAGRTTVTSGRLAVPLFVVTRLNVASWPGCTVVFSGVLLTSSCGSPGTKMRLSVTVGMFAGSSGWSRVLKAPVAVSSNGAAGGAGSVGARGVRERSTGADQRQARGRRRTRRRPAHADVGARCTASSRSRR